jgi:hypothetical protein
MYGTNWLVSLAYYSRYTIVNKYIHKYIHTYIHTYIHAYIYTYMMHTYTRTYKRHCHSLMDIVCIGLLSFCSLLQTFVV